MTTGTHRERVRMSRAALALSAGLAVAAAASPARAQGETASVRSDASPSIELAPRVGVVLPTSKLGPFVMPGLEIGWLAPVAEHRLLLALDASWTEPSYTQGNLSDPSIQSSPYSTTIKESEFVLGIDAVFRLRPPGTGLNFYGGVEPLVYLLRAYETNSFAPGQTNTNDATKLGAAAIAGADFQIGPGALTGEVRFLYSQMDHVLTGSANLGNVVIGVGYRFLF